MQDFFICNFVFLMILLFLMIKFLMIFSGYFFLFLFFVLMIIMLLIVGVFFLVFCCVWCFFCRLWRYFLVYWFYIVFLYFSKCFVCLCRLVFLMWCGCNFGSKLLFKNSIVFGVRRGICILFFMQFNGWLLSVIFMFSRIFCNFFYCNRLFFIVLFRVDLIRLIICLNCFFYYGV